MKPGVSVGSPIRMESSSIDIGSPAAAASRLVSNQHSIIENIEREVTSLACKLSTKADFGGFSLIASFRLLVP